MELKKVFITGASGFVGSQILKTLSASGFEVKVLVHGSVSENSFPKGVEIIEGDIMYPCAWHKATKDCDTMINLVGIIREYPKKDITFKRLHVEAAELIVEVCREVGIERIIHMSANGASAHGVSEYQKTKYEAERIIKSSGLKYTIMRPSLIFGPGDKFLNMIADFMRSYNMFPIFGDGMYKLSPVYVEDVAKSFSHSINDDGCVNDTFQLCGPNIYTYKEILKMLAKALGNKIYLPHIPLSIMRGMTSIFGRFSYFPMTRMQLEMLTEGNVCAENRFCKMIGTAQEPLEKYIEAHFGHQNKAAQ